MNKLQKLQNEITTMGARLSASVQDLRKNAASLSTAQLMDRRSAIEEDQNRLAVLKNEYEQLTNTMGAKVGAPKKEDKPMENNLKNRLASNEYAQAFAYALANGIDKRGARNDEKCHILLDTLTEAGGTPAGTDGGFLVPIDIDNTIHELMRDYGDIAALFAQETVSSPTGWRVTDTAPTSGFSKVSAEFGSIAADDQPAFKQVQYTCDKYALKLPVSNELVNDNVANLFGYISRWYAKKLVITRNGIVVSALKANLTATDIKTDVLAGVKGALNVTLDPAISVGAKFLVNQTGWDTLDQIKDGDSRYMLNPDPTNATLYRAFGREVVPTTDAMLSGKDIFIGNFEQFGTLFTMGGLELASTNIGGNAWATDSTEFRGIVRMGFSCFDSAAAVRLTVKA